MEAVSFQNKESDNLVLKDLLLLKAPTIALTDLKIHLACWNGFHNPLDFFFRGEFGQWQEEQTRRNFERDFILSLIQLPGSNRWMFAGIYKSFGCSFSEETQCFQYITEFCQELSSLVGRLVISFQRSGRSSYLLAERWISSMGIEEIRAEKMSVQAFPGYEKVVIKKSILDTIVKQCSDSWKAPLSSVAGVYLISDLSTGLLYVGSAYGGEGIWQRWVQYSLDGHGGNVLLRKLLLEKGKEYSQNFQYSILEIADRNASQESILNRESYWKSVLCSRDFGLNGN
jgi:hypothetical protein